MKLRCTLEIVCSFKNTSYNTSVQIFLVITIQFCCLIVPLLFYLSCKKVLDFCIASVIGTKSIGIRIYTLRNANFATAIGAKAFLWVNFSYTIKIPTSDPCPLEFTWIFDTCLFYQPRKATGTSYNSALNYCQQLDSELLLLDSTEKSSGNSQLALKR